VEHYAHASMSSKIRVRIHNVIFRPRGSKLLFYNCLAAQKVYCLEKARISICSELKGVRQKVEESMYMYNLKN